MMLFTTLLRSLFKNHLNMRQHKLKLSPVSGSASIPIQEATPKQRKSWLDLRENYFLPFKDQSTRAGKGYQGPLTAIGLQKILLAPVGCCRSQGEQMFTLCRQQNTFLPSFSQAAQVCKNSPPRKQQCSKKY